LFSWRIFCLAFLIFQELRDSKKGKVKDHGFEILRQTTWAKWATRRSTGCKWDQVAWSANQVASPRLIWASSLWCQLFLCGSFRLDLKPTIKESPGRSRRTAAWRSKIQKQRDKRMSPKEFGGGNAAGIASGKLHPLWHVHHHHLQQHHLDTPTVIS
jgi:hypothetical protein